MIEISEINIWLGSKKRVKLLQAASKILPWMSFLIPFDTHAILCVIIRFSEFPQQEMQVNEIYCHQTMKLSSASAKMRVQTAIWREQFSPQLTLFSQFHMLSIQVEREVGWKCVIRLYHLLKPRHWDWTYRADNNHIFQHFSTCHLFKWFQFVIHGRFRDVARSSSMSHWHFPPLTHPLADDWKFITKD